MNSREVGAQGGQVSEGREGKGEERQWKEGPTWRCALQPQGARPPASRWRPPGPPEWPPRPPARLPRLHHKHTQEHSNTLSVTRPHIQQYLPLLQPQRLSTAPLPASRACTTNTHTATCYKHNTSHNTSLGQKHVVLLSPLADMEGGDSPKGLSRMKPNTHRAGDPTTLSAAASSAAATTAWPEPRLVASTHAAASAICTATRSTSSDPQELPYLTVATVPAVLTVLPALAAVGAPRGRGGGSGQSTLAQVEPSRPPVLRHRRCPLRAPCVYPGRTNPCSPKGAHTAGWPLYLSPSQRPLCLRLRLLQLRGPLSRSLHPMVHPGPPLLCWVRRGDGPLPFASSLCPCQLSRGRSRGRQLAAWGCRCTVRP